MSAAQGLSQYSIHAPGVSYIDSKAYQDKYNTKPIAGGRDALIAQASAQSAVTAAPIAQQQVAAAPIARVQTPQEVANAKYMPQLDAKMQQDPSNGYADQLKTLMNGQFSTSDPSYQWRLDQGQKAVERSAAARGLLQSGNAAIELQQYGQGMASQEYSAQFNRTLSAMGASEGAFQNSYNRLAELSGMSAGIQSNSQNTNYNYASLAERAQNNQQQIGLGYAGLAERTQNNQAQVELGRGNLGVNQGQLLDQYMRTGIAQNAQQFQQNSQNNTDQAFLSTISGAGIGTNGYDAWGNSTEKMFMTGTAESTDLPFTMSGYV